MRLTLLPLASAVLLPLFTPQDGTKLVSSDTMRAARVHEYGAAEFVQIDSVPRPVASVNEVLIRVHAASVNPIDWKIISKQAKGRGRELPFILGCDVSGVIESIGAQVQDFQIGDEVFGCVNPTHGGGFAEYVAMPAAEVARKPKSIDHAHAAAVPLAALTAWQALFDTAKLQAGQTVLVHAAAGGVGHFAVQLAHAKGAKVIATASKEKLEFVKQLGADRVIDYRAEKFDELVQDVDVVFDMVGGETLTRSYGVLKKGGFLVSIVERPSTEELQKRDLGGAVMQLKSSAAELAEIAALIDAGKVKPHVGASFPLSETGQALALSKEGHATGKIVLDVVPAKAK